MWRLEDGQTRDEQEGQVIENEAENILQNDVRVSEFVSTYIDVLYVPLDTEMGK